MHNKAEIHNALVGLEVVKVTTKDIAELHKNNPIHFSTLTKFLPEYVITDDSKITRSDYWLQFVTKDWDFKEYVCFDVVFMDEVVGEEIGNDNHLMGGWVAHIRKINPIDFKKYRRQSKNISWLHLELKYMGDYDHYYGGYEWEMEATCNGIVDFNENFKNNLL